MAAEDTLDTVLEAAGSLNLPEDRANILVVDDLPEKLLIYRVILEDLGQNLVFAHSGEEALKLVLQHDFAVILLDVNMPGMDGIETAAMIRKRRKSENTPIIFLTAYADDLHVAEGYKSGAVDFLLTPVMPEVLRAKVRVFVEMSRMRRQAARQAEEAARLKVVEENDRRKDAFIGMLAHELRNPLGPIRNAIRLLQDTSGGDQQLRPLCDIIDRQTMHMARLVDDLLDSTRLASGKIQLRRQRCDMKELVRQTTDDYRSVFEASGLSFSAEVPPEPVWVHGDPTRLAQMVGNLLHNAHKFTTSGGRVSVRLVRDQEDSTATVTVSDTGIGIAPAMLSQIFEVFQQAEQGLDRARGGLGLGLALVKGLSELHRGSIKAESPGPGQGAVFTLKIPLDVSAPAEAAETKVESLQARGRRILIIEDSFDTAETSRLILSREGHDVRVAPDGKSGIAAAHEFQPQVILCDIGLPGIDGYQVAKQLRQDPALAQTYLVALTGYGRESDRRLAREAGFDQHMTKPIDFTALRRTLTDIRRPAQAEPGPRTAAAGE
jgi:signal transduction histidine kinase